MKCQILFSESIRKYFNISSAELSMHHAKR